MFNCAPTMKMPSVKEALIKLAEAKAQYEKAEPAKKSLWARIVTRYRAYLADAVAFERGLLTNNKRHLIA